MSAPRHRLELDLPAVHRGVRVVRNVVARFARMQGMGQQESDEMILIASELLGNAIDHGGGEAAMTEEDLTSDVRMQLAFEMDGERWTLSVTDEGGGDLEEVKKLLGTADFFDLEHDRGRGLFLLKAGVDELDVEASPSGKGLIFRAVKRYGAGG